LQDGLGAVQLQLQNLSNTEAIKKMVSPRAHSGTSTSGSEPETLMSMVSCSLVVEVVGVDDLDLLVRFLGGMVRKM
jgi:hypothetical protein